MVHSIEQRSFKVYFNFSLSNLSLSVLPILLLLQPLSIRNLIFCKSLFILSNLSFQPPISLPLFYYLSIFLSLSLSLSPPPRSTKTHPGPVVHISDNPMDEGKVQNPHSTSLRHDQSPLTIRGAPWQNFTTVFCFFLPLFSSAPDWLWVWNCGSVGLEVQESWLPLQLRWGNSSGKQYYQLIELS